MDKGLYYIGDLCYIINDDELWQEICNNFFEEENGGIIKTRGLTIYMHSTLYGDGVYKDNKNNTYGVDSGTIGCIKIDNAYLELAKQGKVANNKNDITNVYGEEMGIMKQYEEDFLVGYEKIKEQDEEIGLFTFGEIQIYT